MKARFVASIKRFVDAQSSVLDLNLGVVEIPGMWQHSIPRYGVFGRASRRRI
jgi:hypothetical protein